jgi:hypothetical protein
LNNLEHKCGLSDAAVWTQKPDSSTARRDAYGASVDQTEARSASTAEQLIHLHPVIDA